MSSHNLSGSKNCLLDIGEYFLSLEEFNSFIQSNPPFLTYNIHHTEYSDVF